MSARHPRSHRAPRVILTVLVVLAALAVALVLGIHLYASNYYHAEPDALAAEQTTGTVTVSRLDSGDVTFVPARPTTALVFYPGGLVEADAYAPLLSRLAQRGVACVLVRMPENLAVLAPGSADRGRAELEQGLSEVGSSGDGLPWLMAGHSLGGAMAASYVADHTDSYQGLVLLAAYSTKDLSGSGLRTLSIYGSDDGVLDRDRYERCLPNLGSGLTELVIPGGIHSYFGDYGHQDGDGKATITNEEQLDQTAEAISSWTASSLG